VIKSSLDIAFGGKAGLKCLTEVGSRERGGGMVCGRWCIIRNKNIFDS